jgi:hypothetical protein
MKLKKDLENRIRGWLPKDPSLPGAQKTTLSSLGNRLKRHFTIQELPKEATISARSLSIKKL